jgi:hypothetical protein
MSDCLKYDLLLVIVISACMVLLILVAIILYRLGISRKRQAAELERRVHERTIELKKYVDSLRRSQAEKNFLLAGISMRINASLATMKGLSSIATTYENMPADFVRNIDIATDTLADILQQIALEKKL